MLARNRSLWIRRALFLKVELSLLFNPCRVFDGHFSLSRLPSHTTSVNISLIDIPLGGEKGRQMRCGPSPEPAHNHVVSAADPRLVQRLKAFYAGLDCRERDLLRQCLFDNAARVGRHLQLQGRGVALLGHLAPRPSDDVDQLQFIVLLPEVFEIELQEHHAGDVFE